MVRKAAFSLFFTFPCAQMYQCWKNRLATLPEMKSLTLCLAHTLLMLPVWPTRNKCWAARRNGTHFLMFLLVQPNNNEGAGLRIGRFSPHDRLPLPLLLKRCIWIVFEIHLLGTSVSFIDSSSAVSLPCSQRESGFGHFVWINWCIWLNNSLTEELKLDWTGLTSQSWLVNSKSW